MVLTPSLMGIEKEAFTKLFIETIQFGAIISVIILYWRKFFDLKKLICIFLRKTADDEMMG